MRFPFPSIKLPGKPRGLAGYLGLAFTLLSIFLTCALVFLVERAASGHVKQGVGDGLADLALQAADKLDRGMYERYREVGLLAERAELGDASLDKDARRSILGALQASYRYYSWIGLARLDGTVEVAAGGVLEGVNVGARPWFKGALGGTFVGDVHDAVLLARILPKQEEPWRFVDVAFPLRDAQGRLVGVLGSHLSWHWARDVERSIIAPMSARRIDVLIVDRNGVVLLGPKGVQGDTLPLHFLRPVAGRPADFAEQDWPDGRTYLVGRGATLGYADYPGLGWTVLVRQDLDSAYTPVLRLREYALSIGVGLALLFSLAGAMAAGWITRPLKQLAGAARRIQSNQAEIIPDDARQYDEVLELSGALNALVADLVGRGQRVRELNATLEQRVAQRTGELEAALREVRASERHIQAIIETAQDAFIGIGLDGVVSDWNSQSERMFGWRREEALGRQLGELVVPERFRGSLERALKEFRTTGHVDLLDRRRERLVLDRDGREFAVQMSVAMVADGARTFFSIFLQDISARKKVERMKNEFIGTVSHELRTPLTSMHVSLALLADGSVGKLEEPAQELADIAHRHCARLVRLVNDMLDVQKIEAGALQLARRVRPLRPVLADALDALRGSAERAGVALRLDCPPPDADGGEPQAFVDADRLVQVLTNLLSNAIRHSPPGAEVLLSLAAEGGQARIAVADRGEGIPPAFHSRIFERFAQAERRDGKGGGTGLGLSISRSIVLEHGGEIGFVSEEGQGSTFTVSLPLSVVKNQQNTHRQ
jgi:PAS domain S-box-containing protein